MTERKIGTKKIKKELAKPELPERKFDELMLRLQQINDVSK